jgi:hypothetical protein
MEYGLQVILFFALLWKWKRAKEILAAELSNSSCAQIITIAIRCQKKFDHYSPPAGKRALKGEKTR